MPKSACWAHTHTHTHTRQGLLIENFMHFDILEFNKLNASRGRRQAHPWQMCCSCCTVPRSPAGSIEFGSSSSMRKQELDAARGTCCTLLAHAADDSLAYAAASAWLTASSSSMHSCLSAERRSITHSAVSCVPLSTSQLCHALAAACNRNNDSSPGTSELRAIHA